MSEFRNNLWAPWRMEYIHTLCEREADGCFLCRYWTDRNLDAENHVLWRTERFYVVMNLYPYSNGHLLICPAGHKAVMEQLDEEEMLELVKLTRDAHRLLTKAVGAEGVNIGMNFGHCAGAGLPDHLHVHVVPRWKGDTNFMTVLGDVRVIPQALDTLYKRLCDVSAEMNLPQLGQTTGS